MPARIGPLLTLVAIASVALAAGGCGSSSDSGNGSHPDYAKMLAGSPPALAAVHKQANDLIPGGQKAFEQRIAQLHGYPAVVNFWASWCGPCREEFPVLQQLSARYGKQVAFLGVNSEDSSDAAATFLKEEPLSYPSFVDPHKGTLESIGGLGGFPDTAFYDKSGKLVYLKQGPYRNDSELEADVRRYTAAGA